MICELNFIPKTTPRIAKRLPSLDIRSMNPGETMEAYQADIALALGDTDPSSLHSDELASTICTVAINSAQNLIPAKTKTKFPEGFPQKQLNLYIRSGNSGNFYKSLEFASHAQHVTNTEHSVVIPNGRLRRITMQNLNGRLLNFLKHSTRTPSRATRC